MTLRFSDAQGTRVYSKASAEEIGRVHRYVVDAAAQQISAVHVAGRRGNALLAPWSHVVGFGPDAVVIDDEEHLRHPEGDYETAVAGGRLDLERRRVLTDAGVEVGSLIDVEFDESTGRITGLTTDRVRVREGALRAIGPYAVIIRDDHVDATDRHEGAEAASTE